VASPGPSTGAQLPGGLRGTPGRAGSRRAPPLRDRVQCADRTDAKAGLGAPRGRGSPNSRWCRLAKPRTFLTVLTMTCVVTVVLVTNIVQ